MDKVNLNRLTNGILKVLQIKCLYVVIVYPLISAVGFETIYIMEENKNNNTYIYISIHNTCTYILHLIFSCVVYLISIY